MSDVILNLLPLTAGEQALFRAAAPGVEQRFVPLMGPSGETLPLEDPALLEDATVFLGCPSGSVLPRVKNLKWLQTWSAGVDAYLRPGVLPEGCMLTSAVGAYGPAVSEHLFAMLLTLCKRLHLYRDEQNARSWRERGNVKSIAGSTVLVVGAGDIGTHLAAMCKAMGAYTVGLKRNVAAPPEGLDEVHAIAELDTWLPRADVVALVLPHAPETVHIMDARRLGLMKEGSILLNGGRGSAIDPAALLQTLRARKLWGVGLDVTEPEPLPPDSPLWSEPDLLLTPHVAGGFHLEGTRERIVEIMLDNLKRYLSGQPLRNRMK